MMSSSSTNDDAVGSGDRDQPRQAGRHLDDRQPRCGRRRRSASSSSARFRLSDASSGNGRDTSIAERRQHRQDAVAEERVERQARGRRGGRDRPATGCLALGERRQQLVARPARTARRRTRAPAARISRELLAPASGRPGRATSSLVRRPPRSSAGDAHHEELVEVRGGDRRELQALEQRRRRVGGLLERRAR